MSFFLSTFFLSPPTLSERVFLSVATSACVVWCGVSVSEASDSLFQSLFETLFESLFDSLFENQFQRRDILRDILRDMYTQAAPLALTLSARAHYCSLRSRSLSRSPFLIILSSSCFDLDSPIDLTRPKKSFDKCDPLILRYTVHDVYINVKVYILKYTLLLDNKLRNACRYYGSGKRVISNGF